MTTIDEIELNTLIANLVNAVSQRDFRVAVGSLHDALAAFPEHPTYVRFVLSHIPSANDSRVIVTRYARAYPDAPESYLMLTMLYGRTNQIDRLRQTWRDACQRATKGFHFQPAIIASAFDAASGKEKTAIGDRDIATHAVAKMNAAQAIGSSSKDGNVGASSLGAHDCKIVTVTAEPHGPRGVVFDGIIAGFTTPTRYHFRYGFAEDALDHATPSEWLPGGLVGRARAFGDNTRRNIFGFAAALSFANGDGVDVPATMKLHWPYGKDRNHKDGIGIIELLFNWCPSVLNRGDVTGLRSDKPADAPPYPTQTFPGEEIDLRDAEVDICYRSTDFENKAFNLVPWIHGRTGTAYEPERHDDFAAWACTSRVTEQSFVADGQWHRERFCLSGHGRDWSFCGSNVEEMGDGMYRYKYHPIQSVLPHNIGGNICFTMIDGDDLDTPEGDLELAEIALRYRTKSLLAPGQMAEIVDAPNDDQQSAAMLTNGWIDDLAHAWISATDNGGSATFVWRLRDQAEIRSFRLHQHLTAPANDIEIALSNDGADFTAVWSGVLNDIPADLSAQSAPGDAVAIPETALSVVLDAPVEAAFIRLTVLSSHRDGAVGLDAFEVFGDGVPPIPDGNAVSVTELVEELPGSGRIFYELVAENEDGVHTGGVKVFDPPSADKPVVLAVDRYNVDGDTLHLVLRVSAMGQASTVAVTLTDDHGGEINSEKVSIGQWEAPRHIVVRVPEFDPARRYEGLCIPSNDRGPGVPFPVEIPAQV